MFWPSALFIGAWILLIFIPDKYVFYGVSVIAVLSAVWWIRNFFDYYLDAWIITTKGIIDLEWHGWFHRESSRILYSDIEGISYEINGIIPTIFGAGVMTVEKISTGGTISMEFIRNPKDIEKVILEGLEAYMLKKNMKDATTVQNILAEFVSGAIHSNKIKISKES